MSLAIDIRHRLGSFVLDARFEAGGGLVSLFGRSGSGKTSVVNIIAGLIRPDRARVAIDGTVLVDSERGISVPRHRRSEKLLNTIRALVVESTAELLHAAIQSGAASCIMHFAPDASTSTSWLRPDTLLPAANTSSPDR